MSVCPECGEFAKVKYCSLKCQMSYQWQKMKMLIEYTEEFVPTKNGRTAKKYLKEKFGSICELCKRDEWQGKEMPLVLDHIDGNSDNWRVENCRLICPNCDTFTATYKSKNKGNGRYSRRLRYQEGKSY